MGSKKLQVWLPLLLSLMMIMGMMIGYGLRDKTVGNKFLSNTRSSALQEVIDLVKNKYVDPVKEDSLNQVVITEMLAHLDPHSIYVPPTDAREFNEDLMGNFQGIGIEFQVFDDTLNVVKVVEGGPSAKAGLQVGDEILTADDSIRLSGKNADADGIRKHLRGVAGSKVKLSLLRNQKPLTIVVDRGNIPVPTIDAAYIIAPQTGYIRINKFGERTYEEFMQSLEKLQKQGMQKLILDMRDNGGGYVNEAVSIADEFLDEDKLIVYQQGYNQPKKEFRCQKDGLFEKGKLVVLVNESSASATEILTGALQDWDRATIIGRRTFGKGLVQQQFNLSNGGILRLVIARYYTPLGRNIQKPYANITKQEYEDEWLQRFHDGEVVHGDTAKPKGVPFKTPQGHLVYSGGGIAPDIFVPYDTTQSAPAVVKMYYKNLLNNFVYQYYIHNKNTLSGMKSAYDLAKAFNPGEKEWQQLSNFTSKDSVYLSEIRGKDKTETLQRMQALMGRQIWSSEGYYEIINQNDEIVKKALDVLK